MYEVDTTRKERKLFFGFMSLLSFIQSDYSFLNQAPYIFTFNGNEPCHIAKPAIFRAVLNEAS